MIHTGRTAAWPTPLEPPPIPSRKPNTPAAFAETRSDAAVLGGFVRGGIPSRYNVAPGDTVELVARRLDVQEQVLIDANGLAAPYALRPGQVLRVPQAREHVVSAGETVYGISRRYGSDMAALIRLNGIAEPDSIRLGQKLAIPGPAFAARPGIVQTATVGASPEAGSGAALPPIAPRKPLQRPDDLADDATSDIAVGELVPAVEEQAAEAVAIPPPPARQGGKFLWPVSGQVLSDYGPKPDGLHNDGVNIGAPRGTPVYAAENGVVAYVGNELRGFGNLLLLKHSDGWVTAYAHTDEILVQRGERVKRGQIVARVGSTGNVSQPQLHFEVRKGVQAVDPSRLLEARIASAS